MEHQLTNDRKNMEFIVASNMHMMDRQERYMNELSSEIQRMRSMHQGPDDDPPPETGTPWNG